MNHNSKKRIGHNILVLAMVVLCHGMVNAQDNSSSFDWQSYREWQNRTAYSKTYVVDQKHSNASDSNEGTLEKPLKTINRAAELVKAGERVLIYGGVYRETIFPMHGGNSEENMISYESSPGEDVIIKGSKIYDGKWEQRKVFTDVLPDSTLTYTWSRKTWMTTVPDAFFEDGYHPFQLPNILPEEHKLMPWAKLVKKIPPYTSTRALLFQNGKRMTQLEAYGDLTRTPGSYWVDNDGKTIHIHSFDSRDPNNSLLEIGVRKHLLKPQKVGLNYIQVRGLTFEQCPNGFLRTSTGAVTALGGHHWIFENNTIRHINSSGLEFGYLAYEKNDPNPENVARDRKNSMGFNIVKNNEIYDCGTAGIRSFVVSDGIIKNNHIYNCGWQDAENYWECSGIKMLVTHRTLVEGNHIHDIQGGNGIWLDWDIRDSRVTKNIIYNVQNIQGGIFIEASHYPNLVDNNFLWNIDGNGIYANDTDYLMVYHNFVANVTGNAVHAIVQTDRFQNGRKLTAEENLVYNNIFVNTQPMRFSATSNRADYNLYVSTKEPNNIDLQEIRTENLDKNSQQVQGQALFNTDALYLFWKNKENTKEVPKRKELQTDFFNRQLNKMVLPGPFKLIRSDIIPLKEK